MTVGTVTPIRQDSGTVTIGTAIGRSSPRSAGQSPAARTGSTSRRCAGSGTASAPGTGPGAPGDEEIRAWIEETWGQRVPATYNRAVLFRSAFGYWAAQDWRATDPTRPLRRRIPPDRARALSHPRRAGRMGAVGEGAAELDGVQGYVLGAGLGWVAGVGSAGWAGQFGEDLRPGWVSEVQQGDIVIAGRNFGIGSSRPVAALMRHLGVTALVAEDAGEAAGRAPGAGGGHRPAGRSRPACLAPG
jgi:Aconitase C-terminal domain